MALTPEKIALLDQYYGKTSTPAPVAPPNPGFWQGFGNEMADTVTAPVKAVGNVALGVVDAIPKIAEGAVNVGNEIATDPLKATDNLATGFASGVTNTGAGILQRLNSLSGDNVAAFYRHVLPIIRPDLKDQLKTITPDEVNQAISTLAQNNQQLANQNGASFTAGQFAGQVAPIAGVGAELGPIATGAVGGGLSNFLQPNQAPTSDESLKQATDNAIKGAEYGAITGGLIKGVSQIPSVAKSAIQKLSSVDPEKLATFEQAGIRPTLGDVSDSNVVKSTQNFIGEVPLSAGVIDKGRQQSFEDANKILNSVGLGQAKTQQQAGQVVKEGLEGYITRGKEVIGKLYDNLDKHIDPSEPVDTSPVANTINQITSEANTPGLLQGLNNSTAGNIMGRIQGDIEALNGELPYNAIKKYRTEIGNNLQDFHLLKTEDEAVLSRLYGGLSDTMQEAAASNGPQALNAFERANSVNAAFMTKAKQQIEPLLKRDDVQELFNAVLRNQKIGNKAQTVMNTLDRGDQQIIRGSLIKEMGSNNQNDFSAIRAATAIKGLEPEAQTALKSGLPKSQADQFDKAVDALLLMKETASKTNASRSLYGGIAGGSLVGMLRHPIATSQLLAYSHITARLFTNQKFIRWLANAKDGLASDPKAYLGKLSLISSSNPGLSPDIQQFTNSLSQGQTGNRFGNDNANSANLSPEKKAIIDAYYANQAQGQTGNQQPQQPVSVVPVTPAAPANDVISTISNAGQKTGVNPQLLTQIASTESGLNPNAQNPASSASGLFQFTDQTWKDMVNKYGKNIGITENDKNDPEANALMGALFTRDNQQKLTDSLKRPPTPGELYMAHFLGAGGALKLIRNQNNGVIAAKLFREPAKANKTIFFEGKRPRTTQEVYRILNKKVG